MCSPALPPLLPAPEAATAARTLTQRAFPSINALALAAQQKNAPGVSSAYTQLRKVLDALAGQFDPAVVAADILFCPMHPDSITEQAGTPCPKCGMLLHSRRIPYSFTYTKPGEPSLKLTASAGGPVAAKQALEVKVRLANLDGTRCCSRT